MKPKRYTIYALIQPRSPRHRYAGMVRYVGFTSQEPPEKRLQDHLKRSIHTNTYLGAWLRSLGARPGFKILEQGNFRSNRTWQQAECRWILRFPPAQLVNGTAGGDGAVPLDNVAGKAFRAKVSAIVKQRWASATYKRRISKACKQGADRRWSDPNQRAAASNNTKQQMANPKQRELRSKRAKQQWQDPKHKRYMRRINSMVAKQSWADPEYRKRNLVARKEARHAS